MSGHVGFANLNIFVKHQVYLRKRKQVKLMPMTSTQLQPVVPDYPRLKEKEQTLREKQKDNFDSRHRSRELTLLTPGESVWVTDQQTQETVVQLSSPRSYQIQTPSGMLRMNRRHLNPLRSIASEEIIEPDQDVVTSVSPEPELQTTTELPSNVRHTRSGRISVPPFRLVEDQNWE